MYFHRKKNKILNYRLKTFFNFGLSKLFNMNLYTIETGYFKLDGGAMFGVVPKVLWSKTNPADDKIYALGLCVPY